MGKRREKNNVIKYSQTKQNNELFREQVNKKRIKEDDLLGKTRAITLLEKTQLLNPVKDEQEEIVLPKLKKEVKKSKKIVLALLVLLLVSVSLLSCFFLFRHKFKNVTIEVGYKDLSLDTFLVSKMYKKNATLVTDIDEIDLDKVGEYTVTLKYKNKEEDYST